MKLIIKDKEPAEWKAFRETPGAKYKANKSLRQSLYKEQGGICAYCMQRLDDNLSKRNTHNRIEHIKSEAGYPQLQLVYSNMIMCCNGLTLENKHCDLAKENKEISFSPLDNGFIESLSYRTSDGTIISSNAIWNEEINKVLNLNAAPLKSNRKKTLKGIINCLTRRHEKWRMRDLKREIDNWSNKDADGLYYPYCGMVIWFLNKKLNIR